MRMPAEYWFHEGCYITEWSNSEADPACSIARARVEPGRTTAWHWLRDTTERYAILSGQGVLEMGLPGQHPCHASVQELVGPGAVVLIPADVPQRIRNTGTEDLIFLAVCTPRFRSEVYAAEETQTPAR